jgi:aspartate/methionine/tyrosine aminotransferase
MNRLNSTAQSRAALPTLHLPMRRYGAEQGQGPLREAICDRFYAKLGRKPNEIFVSDGSKCDIGRLQLMFGADVTVAAQVGQLDG